MKIIRFIFLLLALVSTTVKLSAEEADRIIGVYAFAEPETGMDSKIRIYKTNSGVYQGEVIWIKNPYDKNGNIYLDRLNPDENLRNTPCNQVIMLRNFKYVPKEQEWSGGEIYNPANGKTYKSYMKFESDSKLKVRGYVGISMFGKSMYWTKIK